MQARGLKVGDVIRDGVVGCRVRAITEDGVVLRSQAHPSDSPWLSNWNSIKGYYRHEDGSIIDGTPPAPAAGLDEQKLARAIFDSDPRVTKFISQIGDFSTGWEKHAGGVVTMNFNSEQYLRICNTVWERNEKGWRTEAVDRAEEIIALMGRK